MSSFIPNKIPPASFTDADFTKLEKGLDVDLLDFRVAALSQRLFDALAADPELKDSTHDHPAYEALAAKAHAKVDKFLYKDLGEWSTIGLFLSALYDFFESLSNVLAGAKSSEQTFGVSFPHKILREITLSGDDLLARAEKVLTVLSEGRDELKNIADQYKRGHPEFAAFTTDSLKDSENIWIRIAFVSEELDANLYATLRTALTKDLAELKEALDPIGPLLHAVAADFEKLKIELAADKGDSSSPQNDNRQEFLNSKIYPILPILNRAQNYSNNSKRALDFAKDNADPSSSFVFRLAYNMTVLMSATRTFVWTPPESTS